MVKKYKWILIFLIVFPVIITVIVKMANKETTERFKSGRTVIIENDGYTIKMDVEDFIPCVLMAQMEKSEFSSELIKAQSVVIRTYIYYCIKNSQSIEATQLGLSYIPYCKLEEIWYRKFCGEKANTPRGFFYNLTGLGKSRCLEENLHYWDSIMKSTRGNVLKSNGKIVLPLFHLTSNGNTRSGEKILGQDYGYLKEVACKSDLQKNDYIGIKYFTVKEFIDTLNKNGIVVYKDKKEKFDYSKMDSKDLLNIINCKNVDEQGYLLWAKIGDTKISGDLFAKALGLQSTSLQIDECEKGIRVTTKGIGHGFGMSLSFGNHLAKEGANWKEILRKFYDCSIVDN